VDSEINKFIKEKDVTKVEVEGEEVDTHKK
jgi:hypothetical protein